MNTLSKTAQPLPSNAAPNPVLRIERLSKRYNSFAMREISLAVEPGTIVGLVGSNGAGKTTLIKSILGIVHPDNGSIALFGEEVVGAPEQRLSALKQAIGIVLDACSFPDECTVKTTARAMRNVYENWNDKLFWNLAEQFNLAEKTLVKALSRGMGMKLSLACALAHRPRLLVLDEATAGLDPIARDEMLGLLRTFVAEDESRAILLSSHITSDLDKIADRVACIDAGKLIFDVERDAIDLAGVALCRATDVEAIERSRAYQPGELRFERTAYSTRVFVPNRFAFAEAFPAIPIEAIDVETYMHFMLKGATL